MNYTHLTISERVKIENHLALDYSIRAIAQHLHRSLSTISRELRCHPDGLFYRVDTSALSSEYSQLWDEGKTHSRIKRDASRKAP